VCYCTRRTQPVNDANFNSLVPYASSTNTRSSTSDSSTDISSPASIRTNPDDMYNGPTNGIEIGSTSVPADVVRDPVEKALISRDPEIDMPGTQHNSAPVVQSDLLSEVEIGISANHAKNDEIIELVINGNNTLAPRDQVSGDSTGTMENPSTKSQDILGSSASMFICRLLIVLNTVL
jgi:hypothetical protein